MLRINQHMSAAAAKEYYQSHLSLGDYYSKELGQGVEVISEFRGKLADTNRLGIAGKVDKQVFFDLVENIHPGTKERLTKRHNGEGKRRVGWDFTFDVGDKSISAYFARTGDQRILKAFDEAVHETMQEIEGRIMVRVRQGGANEHQTVGAGLWSAHTHLTTRPLKDGTVDPHIHQHVFLHNLTWSGEYQNRDGSKGAYLAAEINEGIWNYVEYLQSSFNARMAKKLDDMGFNVERVTPKPGKKMYSFRLPGFEQHKQAFSRRSAAIDEWSKKHGVTNADDLAKGGRLTRSSKSKMKLTMDQQVEEWQSRLSDEQWDQFVKTATSPDGGGGPGTSVAEAVEFGLNHNMERASTPEIEHVLQSAFERAMGSIDVDEARAHLLAREDVISAWYDHKLRVTTKDEAEREQYIEGFVRQGRGACLPLGREDFRLQKFRGGEGNFYELNADQKQAVLKVLASTSRVTTLRGAPGVGKTTALSEIIRGIEEAGGHVMAIAPTANSRDKMIEDGEEKTIAALASATTWQKLISDKELQSELERESVLVLDESSMIGTKSMKALVEEAEKRGFRFLLVGDYFQHGPVEAGNPFYRMCQIEQTAEISKITRQVDPDYNRLVQFMSNGTVAGVQAGMDLADKLGAIVEMEKGGERYQQIADAYLNITSERKGNRGKKITFTEEQKQDSRSYRAGMTIYGGRGKSSWKAEVVGRDDGKVVVQDVGDRSGESHRVLDLSAKFSVYEATYKKAIVVTPAHKEGGRVTRLIREARRKAGELGKEQTFDQLVDLKFTEPQKTDPLLYKPGMVIEFQQKARARTVLDMGHGGPTVRKLPENTATKLGHKSGGDIGLVREPDGRSITYKERFVVVGHDGIGNVVMEGRAGEKMVLPLDRKQVEKFGVYESKKIKVAENDVIMITKNGYALQKSPKDRKYRLTNNEFRTVKGFDEDGNMIDEKGKVISAEYGHFRHGYYKTSMSSQSETVDHLLVAQAKESFGAASMEQGLVTMSRGKYAVTLFTNDKKALRDLALTKSNLGLSATELQEKQREQQAENATRMAEQKTMLARVAEFAGQARDRAWNIIRRVHGGMEQVTHQLEVKPRHSRSL